ncbi:hypothetical protein GUITHDRAFT_106713 [Guillardia theta CCMP2712]|uniref:PX domain-containing protein n=1 Tax=Guillardia theta (strain CCMP2712) TaxID=905079 RepID=L1JGQ7_GUITC|nr:hypothetical protein GUITHDRAFT_106713 [Guillardia theta CCMP2712]EKX47265.1 hypothetical protein GUITHDRAFT_106713 [Guillardia theta CCMP2712]|eukprot:XP_005834245.1 hypothetical protein GUITHDRAFT_106713 [Guillardia theta CCMP2712]
MSASEAVPESVANRIPDLNLQLRSISSLEVSQRSKPKASALTPEASHDFSQDPEVPAVDLSKLPAKGSEFEVLPMLVEHKGWPCQLLFDVHSWILHTPNLENHNRKPGIRVILAKAETHGPKTTPYTIYVMHVKTAFSVRGISRRFSDFKKLDEELRQVKRSAPPLPRKKVFGKMAPKFINERMKQLQSYVDAIMRDPACASSPPFRAFLETRGHAIEEDILDKVQLSRDNVDVGILFPPWRLATGTRVEAVQGLVERSKGLKDVRQQARALNQLAMVHREEGDIGQGLEAIRQAVGCCRQVDEDVGEHALAELRLREAQKLAADYGDVSGQALCHYSLAMVKCSRGGIAEAGKDFTCAAELFVNIKEYGLAALSLFVLGCILLQNGEVRQAVEVLESSLLLRRRAKEKIGLAETLCALGQAFAEIGYQLHAMDYFNQALALCQA